MTKEAFLLPLCGALLWAGSLSAASAASPRLQLDYSFLGKLHGSGTSQDTVHGARSVAFSGVGTATPYGLRLSYDVTFSDGERQHKVWTFKKMAAGYYIGQRADVIGNAQVTQSGDDIHMTYTARVPTKSGEKNVNFDEHFTLTPSGTIVNRVAATYLVFNVGSATIAIDKTASRSKPRQH